MPAYHLIARDGAGITLVNIGVGLQKEYLRSFSRFTTTCLVDDWPLWRVKKAKNWRLCSAHAYLRDDHILDDVLPPDIPIPSIAEVQRALYDATKQVSNMPGELVKQRLRTGTVVTTDDRNWELRFCNGSPF